VFGAGRRPAALDELRDLKPGWDSYDAEPIRAEIVEQAKFCLHEVERFLGSEYAAPIIEPTADGGVALIWRKPGRGEVTAVFAPSAAKYVVIGDDRQFVGKGPIGDCGSFAREVLKRRLA
jgi:hypothetical protein